MLPWLVPSIVIVLLVTISPLLAWTRVLAPDTAFGPFFVGAFLAFLSVPTLAGAAAFASATGRSWRGRAAIGAIVPFLVVAVLILPNTGHPPIHDATTDAQDTLDFSSAVERRAESLTREEVLAMQRERSPDLAPVVLPIDPAKVFEYAKGVAERSPAWKVERSDPATGRIEAIVESGIFRFVDDVVIRIQPDGTGSRIDMRSRSRFGQSDLGANAERVRAFLAQMTVARLSWGSVRFNRAS